MNKTWRGNLVFIKTFDIVNNFIVFIFSKNLSLNFLQEIKNY